MKKTANIERIAAVCACLLMLVAFYVSSEAVLALQARTVQMLMQTGILALIGAAAWLMYARPKLNRSELLLWMILVIGIVMRVGYMIYTPATVRGHDLGKLDFNYVGHATYIMYLIEGSMPPYNFGQFYHPPLFHALAAAVMRCYRVLSGIVDMEQLFESTKVVSCAASILTLFYARRLCRQLRLSYGATLIALALAAFLPNHYLLAGRVNNDALSIMFMTAILYYTLAWYEKQDWGSIVKLALCFGLGMMTKISVGVFALVTGAMMLFVLIRSIREKRARRMILQLIVFGLIALPLGMYFPIRSYILFQQPFDYVQRMPEESRIYCDDHSIWERFGLIFNPNVYNLPFDDYNVWGYLLRGSLFGEFTLELGRFLPGILLLVNLLLILMSLVAMVVMLIRHRSAQYTLLGCFWLVLMAAYIQFNIEYPCGCTMDFRYVVPTALIGAVFLGAWWEKLPDNRPVGRLFRRAAIGLTGCFAILSLVLYCNLP